MEVEPLLTFGHPLFRESYYMCRLTAGECLRTQTDTSTTPPSDGGLVTFELLAE